MIVRGCGIEPMRWGEHATTTLDYAVVVLSGCVTVAVVDKEASRPLGNAG
jgi:hypothetical protein